MSLFKLIIRFSNKISNDSTLLELELVTYGWRLSNKMIPNQMLQHNHTHTWMQSEKKNKII